MRAKIGVKSLYGVILHKLYTCQVLFERATAILLKKLMFVKCGVGP